MTAGLRAGDGADVEPERPRRRSGAAVVADDCRPAALSIVGERRAVRARTLTWTSVALLQVGDVADCGTPCDQIRISVSAPSANVWFWLWPISACGARLVAALDLQPERIRVDAGQLAAELEERPVRQRRSRSTRPRRTRAPRARRR